MEEIIIPLRTDHYYARRAHRRAGAYEERYLFDGDFDMNNDAIIGLNVYLFNAGIEGIEEKLATGKNKLVLSIDAPPECIYPLINSPIAASYVTGSYILDIKNLNDESSYRYHYSNTDSRTAKRYVIRMKEPDFRLCKTNHGAGTIKIYFQWFVPGWDPIDVMLYNVRIEAVVIKNRLDQLSFRKIEEDTTEGDERSSK